MLKTLLVAATFASAPLAAYAQYACKSHQAMSCAEGTVWDVQTGTCVAQASS